ncbi:MAG: AraC family transcriptional regulator [Verrucomicrobia bacterium]|nr:AraC family transcriptional regulator [Verrucomicrobiota bacterium]
MQRHFRDVFGLKLQEWLNHLRLDDAKHLLNGDRMVKEVAFSLGFKKSNHFSREFKKAHGLSPEVFAKTQYLCNPQFEFEIFGH